MNTLVLERFSYAPTGTFGTLRCGDKEFYTCERPWLSNQEGKSCIPEGVYSLGKRYSPMMKRTTGGEFEEGWEVQDVPNRTFIMIHPANFVQQLKGCISLGLGFQIIPDKQGIYRQAVTSSRSAVREFMNYMERSNEWDLHIIPKLISYP